VRRQSSNSSGVGEVKEELHGLCRRIRGVVRYTACRCLAKAVAVAVVLAVMVVVKVLETRHAE
jgi:hypothetical protein